MNDNRVTIEEVTDPDEAAHYKARHERVMKNLDWLQGHWADLLPQVLGKYLAVAGQEAYIADTPEEARAWAAKVHPEDSGALVRYVRPERGPRIYAHTRDLEAV